MTFQQKHAEAIAHALLDGAKIIPLTRDCFAIVDADDYESLSRREWRLSVGRNEKAYAKSSIRRNKQYFEFSMHRLIAKAPDDMVVDHINGDTLDNRKRNLRICTNAENMRNRKVGLKPKGIRKRHGRYTAQIKATLGKIMHLGTFDTEIEAMAAYNSAAIKYHGDFACLNDIQNWQKVK